MSDQSQDSSQPVYALRLQERAVRDITAAYVRMADLVSLTVADEWREELKASIAGLATNPRRYPLAPEPFKREVRQLIFRRPGSKMAYRVLFTITGIEEQSPDPPTVTILHVRHAASRRISRAQAREIESTE